MSGAYGKGRPKKYDAISGKGNKPPKVAGEYRIRDKDNNLKYLGISNDINRRVKEHKKKGKINEYDRIVEWMPAKPGTSYADIRRHEREKIKQKKPLVNERGGGAGPTPKRMNYLESSFPNGDHSSKGKKQGCYIATCVYGSYDCPPVWTLRRYRDYVLSKSILGRCFIRVYYALSPIAVKLFGNTQWFRHIFRLLIDRIVKRLKESGIGDEHYYDTNG